MFRWVDPEHSEVRAGQVLGPRLSPDKSFDSEPSRMGLAGVTTLQDHDFRGRRPGRCCGAGLGHGCQGADLGRPLSVGAAGTLTFRPPWNRLTSDLTVQLDAGCDLAEPQSLQLLLMLLGLIF